MPTNAPFLVGITGGIGAGKSTVCEIFSVLDIPSYDSDTQAKKLMAEDPVLIQSIEAAFGEKAYLPSGDLNRAYLASAVFSDPEKLKQLNDLVHPAVGRDFAQWALLQKKCPYLIKEAALLFESGAYKSLDCVVLVTAPEALRIKRVLARDSQRNEKQVREIIANQMEEGKKEVLADFILSNDDAGLLVPKVVALHQELLHLASKKAPQGA